MTETNLIAKNMCHQLWDERKDSGGIQYIITDDKSNTLQDYLGVQKIISVVTLYQWIT